MKRFYYAVTGQFEAVAMEQVVTDYRTRFASKEAVKMAECSSIPLNSPGSTAPAFTSPAKPLFEAVQASSCQFTPKEPASVEVTR